MKCIASFLAIATMVMIICTSCNIAEIRPLKARRTEVKQSESQSTSFESKPQSKKIEISSVQSKSVDPPKKSVPIKEKYDKNGQYIANNFPEMKATWISYLELQDILTKSSKSQFQKRLGAMLDNIRNMGLNTVILHARPYADALYKSELYPTSSLLTEKAGSKMPFDPLSIAVSEAHKRGLSIHAWINPLRGQTTKELKLVDDKFVTKKWYNNRKKSDKIWEKEGRWYFNPAYPDVRKLIADGAKEIVKKYDVDGLHFDDYFYPTTSKKFDKIAKNKFGRKMTLAQFRLSNCNKMVKETYQVIHKQSKTIKFGISPQGSIQNNYNSQYADVKRWCKEGGYVDYISPQIYFGFKNTTSPFEQTVKQWKKITTNKKVSISVGLAMYKVGMKSDQYAGKGKKEWNTGSADIIKRQIEYLKRENLNSFILYGYKAMFDLKSGKQIGSKRMAEEMDNIIKLLV